MDELRQALLDIQERNARVEQQKAWEVSLTRRLFIAAMTYTVAYLYMRYGLEVTRPHLDAFVPTGGYLLSTYSLPFVREWWSKTRYIKAKGT
jgi:hypothetical protein